MSSAITSIVKEKERHQPQHDIEQTEYNQSLLPQDIFVEGEKPLFESRSILWPLLTRPVVYMIIGLVILLYMNRIPLDSLGTLLGISSAETVQTIETIIRNIIKWAGVGILALGGLGVIIRWLYWRGNIYTATNRRILRQTGIIAKSYKDCSFNKIQTLYMRMPLLGRIFGFGTIKLATAGTASTEIQWDNLKNPKNVYRRLSAILEDYRQDKLG
jgi:membrane protein YdbS with pleckstrin-like domain